jgi:hypothetical protein
MRNHGRRSKQQKSGHSGAQPPIIKPDDHNSADREPASSETQKSDHNAVRSRATLAEWCSVVVQGIAAVILLYYTSYTYHMWKAMETSNKLAQGSSATTAQLVSANLALADAAKASATEAKRLADASKAANAQALEIAAVQRWAAEENLRETKSSLVISQRAWLTISAIEHKLPSKGEILQVGITNVGHTPARDVVIAAGATVGKGEPAPLNILHPKGQRIGGSATTIGAGVTTFLTVDFVHLTDDELDAVRQGKISVYIFGEIIYNDIFSDTHRHLRFCDYFQPSTTSWAACSSGNNAD